MFFNSIFSTVLLFGSAAWGAPSRLHAPVEARGQKTYINADDMHYNVLQSYPSEKIINSSSLYEYLKQHQGANHSVYLSDVRAWVPMHAVRNKSSSQLSPRQVSPCFEAPQQQLSNTYSYWSAWSPASDCVQSGLDPAGGSPGVSYSYSIGYTETAGLGFNALEGALGATFSFAVTETYGTSGSYTCNAPGNSVAQVWIQHMLAAGDLSVQECTVCPPGPQSCSANSTSSFTAPAKNGGQGMTQYGCSAGANNVSCNTTTSQG